MTIARPIRRALVLALVAAGLAAAPARAESVSFPARGAQTQRLIIHAATDVAAMTPLIRDFQATRPGIAVDYDDLPDNALFEAMRRACDSGRAPADIVISAAVDHVVKLANDGCARPRAAGPAPRLPAWAQWRDEVFGFAFEPAVIVYNRTLVPPEDVPHDRPHLIELLRAKPQAYDGRIGTTDIERSEAGYLLAFFDAQESSSFGRLLERIGRANEVLSCCTDELLSAIESGKVLIGYNLTGSAAYRRLRAGAPIGIVLPRDYTLMLSRAAMIPVGAPDAEAGQAFLDYLLSERGQAVAAEQSFFFAVDRPPPPGVDAPGLEESSSRYRPIPVGPSLLAALDQARRKRFLADWRAAIDGH
ncbi:ABC transporter substrate-binding protein [Labrys wisconsinensis]|uniref:Iron(III) transport system substrate-binding protein n=1 Tax=Labrys wisconsinensis TaxID=425677 RepID=A0ABU0JCG7_9HYPH|nr:ABC transporter substrate-binding protein [Labrys wisconsinensis]MDQ0471980.1 iron(III) transport system substrate-binding protein [Labrys wisconsinensis]